MVAHLPHTRDALPDGRLCRQWYMETMLKEAYRFQAHLFHGRAGHSFAAARCTSILAGQDSRMALKRLDELQLFPRPCNECKMIFSRDTCTYTVVSTKGYAMHLRRLPLRPRWQPISS